MAEYLGWEAIGRALGCGRLTARRLFLEQGLLVYRKARPYGRQRWCWATTDTLILAWQIARSRVDRADALAARERRRATATTDSEARRDG